MFFPQNINIAPLLRRSKSSTRPSLYLLSSSRFRLGTGSIVNQRRGLSFFPSPYLRYRSPVVICCVRSLSGRTPLLCHRSTIAKAGEVCAVVDLPKPRSSGILSTLHRLSDTDLGNPDRNRSPYLEQACQPIFTDPAVNNLFLLSLVASDSGLGFDT